MHVVFDMDGVLLDAQADPAWLDRALDATLEAFDLEPTPERRELLHPKNLRDFERAATSLGVSPADLWSVRHRNYVREKDAAIRAGAIGPFPDVEEVCALSREYPVSIISNSPESIVETFLEAADLGDVVQHAIGRGESMDAIERMKPDPAFYEELDRRAGDARYVYVGDAASDALFAQRTGMAFVHLDREVGEATSLAEAADRIRVLD
ncbi:MAG: HAD family hydrolase [Halodesulfurarchaeum sp.]